MWFKLWPLWGLPSAQLCPNTARSHQTGTNTHNENCEHQQSVISNLSTWRWRKHILYSGPLASCPIAFPSADRYSHKSDYKSKSFGQTLTRPCARTHTWTDKNVRHLWRGEQIINNINTSMNSPTWIYQCCKQWAYSNLSKSKPTDVTYVKHSTFTDETCSAQMKKNTNIFRHLCHHHRIGVAEIIMFII